MQILVFKRRTKKNDLKYFLFTFNLDIRVISMMVSVQQINPLTVLMWIMHAIIIHQVYKMQTIVYYKIFNEAKHQLMFDKTFFAFSFFSF